MSALGVGIIGCGNISAAYLRLAPLFKDITVKADGVVAGTTPRVRTLVLSARLVVMHMCSHLVLD